MFTSVSLSLLSPLFILAAAAVWFAGIQLSNTTDIIDSRFSLGEAFGGMIFLTISTNLPEIAIVVSASLHNNPGIIIGNILGGIAIQTVVLVLLDGFGLRKTGSLTSKAASLQIMLEGLLVICVLVIVIMGSQFPSYVIFKHIAPADLSIFIVWIIGLYLIYKARKGLPWHEQGRALDTPPITKSVRQEKIAKWSMTRTVLVFILAALITLVAGVILEESSNAIAVSIGWSNVLFATTILAAATALPEI